jgi:hypothetical protein
MYRRTVRDLRANGPTAAGFVRTGRAGEYSPGDTERHRDDSGHSCKFRAWNPRVPHTLALGNAQLIDTTGDVDAGAEA